MELIECKSRAIFVFSLEEKNPKKAALIYCNQNKVCYKHYEVSCVLLMTKYLYQQYQHEWNHQYSFPTNLVSSVKDSKLALCLRYQFYNENVFCNLKMVQYSL